MKSIILLLVSLFATQAMSAQKKENIDWNTDLKYLAKELPEKHYNFFTIHNQSYLEAGINAIIAENNTLTNFQIALKTQQLVAKFGDLHTMLNFTQMIDKNKILPIHLLWTSGGLYILHTTNENKEILGRKLLAINDTPITTIIDSLSTLITNDNEAVIKSQVPKLIPYLEILQHFGFADKDFVELSLDENKNYTLKPSLMDRRNRVSFKPDSISFSIKNENTFFISQYFSDSGIYHILYNKCWSKELESEFGNKQKAENMPSFQEFEDNIFTVLKNQQVNKIIFDMRFNGGGNSSQGGAFINKLAEYLKKNPPVKIYVVLGRGTFSSAILNAMDFKRLTNAIFVGEETSGKPNHFGEVKHFQLPSSKLYVSYSTKYFKRSDENLNTISPDVIIEMSFSDFTKGIDPVFEWVKNQQK